MGQAKRKSRKLSEIVAREHRCIYCVNPATSTDHMPAISMFRGRSRPSGMEFGACADCNRGTRGADVVAAFLARISQTVNAAMITEAANLRSNLLKAAPGVVDELLRPDKKQNVWRSGPGGIYRPMVAVKMDGKLTQTYLTVFAAKLGMALYREHIGEALPLNGAVLLECYLNAGLAERTAEGILQKLPSLETLRQGRFMVPDQFAYRYNHDGKSIIAALAGFHSNLHIFVVATSQPEVYFSSIAARRFNVVRPGAVEEVDFNCAIRKISHTAIPALMGGAD